LPQTVSETKPSQALLDHFAYWATERKWALHPQEALDERMAQQPADATLVVLKDLVARYSSPQSPLQLQLRMVNGELRVAMDDLSRSEYLLGDPPTFIVRDGHFVDAFGGRTQTAKEFSDAVAAEYAGKKRFVWSADPLPTVFRPFFLAKFPDGRLFYVDESANVQRAFIGVPGNMKQLRVDDFSYTSGVERAVVSTELGTFVTGFDQSVTSFDTGTQIIPGQPTGFLANGATTPVSLERIDVEGINWKKPTKEALQLVKSLGGKETIEP
jgi:hypothetical protein